MTDLTNRALEYDCKVFFDPSLAPNENPHSTTQGFDAILMKADMVKAIPSNLANAGFDSEDLPEFAMTFHYRGPHTVFLTLGEDGAYTSASGKLPFGFVETQNEGYNVDPLNSTGVGDAFVAGALAALSDAYPISTVLSFANAVVAASKNGNRGDCGASLPRNRGDAPTEVTFISAISNQKVS